MLKKPFPHYHQPDSKDCGPTCLKIVAKHYGKTISMQTLRHLSETTREGSNLLTLSEASESLGFRTLGVRISLEKLTEVPLPCILHWNKNHYVVLYELKKSLSFGEGFRVRSKDNIHDTSLQYTFKISDPAHGLIEYNQALFLKFWIGNNATSQTEEGIALLLEPTPKFYNNEFVNQEENTFGSFRYLMRYVLPYRSFVFQLAIGLLAGTLLQLIFPFLTQSIVDIGIQNQNMHFVYLILIAQL